MITRQRKEFTPVWREIAKGRQYTPDSLTLTLPDGVFTMNRGLLERCWLAKEISGGHIYHPDFIASLPINYLYELAMFGQGVKFFEDMGRRPREMIEEEA